MKTHWYTMIHQDKQTVPVDAKAQARLANSWRWKRTGDEKRSNGNIMGISWEYHGNIMNKCMKNQTNHGNIMGIS